MNIFQFLRKVVPIGFVAVAQTQIFCIDDKLKQKTTSTYMWGNGFYQAIPGAPIQFNNFYPKKIQELANFKAFAFAQQLEAGINSQGQLFIWPSVKRLSYQSPSNNQKIKNMIKLLDNVKQVKFTNGFVWALNNKGQVYQWKINKKQQDVFLGEAKHIKPLKNITQISAGEDHLIALDNNGKVFAMGQNTLGQCGLLDNSRTTSSPFIENRISYPQHIQSLPPIKKIECGTNHSLAIDFNGQLYGWGSNSNMQISHQQQFSKAQNPLLCSYCPLRLIKNLDNNKVIDVSAGEQFTIISTQNTRDKTIEVFSVGNNLKGQLGIGQVQHLKDIGRIDNLSNYVFNDSKGESQIVKIQQIGCGRKHIIALLNIGYVLEWGDNEFGQMGNKKRSLINKPAVMKEFMGKKVQGVFAGENTSVVIVEDQ